MLKFAILAISFLLPTAFSVAGIAPEMQRNLNLTQSQVDFFLSLPAIATAIAVLGSNIVVNKIGMKKTVALGLLIIGISGIFPFFIQNFSVILLSRFIFGVGVGLVNPLAVSYISFLFDNKEVPKLIGFRGSIEFAGQSILTVLAGLLLVYGWHFSFLIFILAFVVLVIFYVRVPEVKVDHPSNAITGVSSDKLPKLIFPIFIFTFILIASAAAIGMRFPSLASEANGPSYNPSLLLALQPLVNIFASLFFGKLHHALGRKLLYLSLALLAISHFLLALSNGHYWMIVLGFFIHGFVPGWTIPFIFNAITSITSGKTQNLALSIIITGFNVAIFAAPHIVGLIENMIQAENLTAAYPFYVILVTTLLLGVIFNGKKISLAMQRI